MDLEEKMFKWSLKETGCQEQFSNQRGIKRFNLYFTLIQKTCLRGEVVLKWTHQLKWKKFPTIQHEKGPLVNEPRCWGTQGMPQKKVKEELHFGFDWKSISVPEEMCLVPTELLGIFHWKIRKPFRKSSKSLAVRLTFTCVGCRYSSFFLCKGHSPSGVGNRC